VGITTKGRRGPSSRRVAVPLVPSPRLPSRPEVTYTETAVTVRWESLSEKLTYNVYEVPASTRLTAAVPAQDAGSAQQLTKTAIAETQYTDSRLTWGATRCYVVRSVETVGALSVESEATPPACVTLADTFPPAAPKGLQAVATEGFINLIWDENTETDLDVHLLRGVSQAMNGESPSCSRDGVSESCHPACGMCAQGRR
jgi:hypothetical protein